MSLCISQSSLPHNGKKQKTTEHKCLENTTCSVLNTEKNHGWIIWSKKKKKSISVSSGRLLLVYYLLWKEWVTFILKIWNEILHDRYLFSLWEFPSKDCQAQSVTDEATVGLSLDSTLAVWSMAITVVTSENNKSSIQYIRWPKMWPVEHSVVANSCPM